jgi:predicted RNA binding protein YcfA (HicA-like mRNA interferase family)
MKSVSGRELARMVERHGWRLLRVSGSHHGNRALKTGLLLHLLKIAEIDESEL